MGEGLFIIIVGKKKKVCWRCLYLMEFLYKGFLVVEDVCLVIVVYFFNL